MVILKVQQTHLLEPIGTTSTTGVMSLTHTTRLSRHRGKEIQSKPRIDGTRLIGGLTYMNVHIYSDQMWIDAADKYYLEDNKKHTMVYI